MRVKISHPSLNRHDLFSLRGITAQPEPIPFPMILGNDGAGTLEDGTPVVIYPAMGSDDWRDDETLDPRWYILSERVAGTFADYVAVPSRIAIPLPEGGSQLAPNLISADNTSRTWAESAVQSVLRCHQLWEIGRVGAYFDHLSLNCKQRRTRWRRKGDLNLPGAQDCRGDRRRPVVPHNLIRANWLMVLMGWR